MTAPRVAVVLVNFGSYANRYLEECLRTLKEQDYPPEQMKLLIVDNGSTPASRALLSRWAPAAEIVAHPDNLGWSGGNNLALKQVLADTFDYVVFLNMDILLERMWLSALVRAAETHPETAIWQPKILLHGTSRINSVGNRIHFLGYGYCIGYGEPDNRRVHAQMDFASGASLLVRRDLFEKIGLFREEYFLYYDDMEFCWRARLAGYGVGLAEESICHHKYEFGKMKRFIYLLERNRLLTLLTLEEVPTLLLIGPALVLFQMGAFLYFTATGHGVAMLRLIGYFLRPNTWREIRNRRKEIKHLRKRGDGEIVGKFAGSIQFAEIRNPLFTGIINPLLRAYWAVARNLLWNG